VAVRSAEAPPELLAAADLVLDGPPGVLGFLRLLVDLPAGTVPAPDREESL
jgi:hypothetical protein